LTFNDPTKKERQTCNLVADDHSSAVTFLIDWLEEQPEGYLTQGCETHSVPPCQSHLRALSNRLQAGEVGTTHSAAPSIAGDMRGRIHAIV